MGHGSYSTARRASLTPLAGIPIFAPSAGQAAVDAQDRRASSRPPGACTEDVDRETTMGGGAYSGLMMGARQAAERTSAYDAVGTTPLPPFTADTR